MRREETYLTMQAAPFDLRSNWEVVPLLVGWCCACCNGVQHACQIRKQIAEE